MANIPTLLGNVMKSYIDSVKNQKNVKKLNKTSKKNKGKRVPINDLMAVDSTSQRAKRRII